MNGRRESEKNKGKKPHKYANPIRKQMKQNTKKSKCELTFGRWKNPKKC